MRSLAPLLLLLAGLVPLRAQWQIFAEKLPAPGTWASFRMETLREGKVVSTGDLRFSVRPGREVEGKPHVWFTVEPVMWLGSRERAPLRLQIRPDMDRKAASRLIENAAEIGPSLGVRREMANGHVPKAIGESAYVKYVAYATGFAPRNCQGQSS